uniref:Lipocalin n=1 Tax=Argas monolakensis TaxID=34602 RepID=Q09JR1_ARGMO|nr:lipocalin [Argas monolakensis]
MHSKNEEEGFVVHKMEFWDTRASRMAKVETRLTTKKSKGYKISNLLVPQLGPSQGPGGPEAVFPLAFTDYETCAIIRVPEKDGCQLWTYEEGLRSLNGYCHFIYNVLCGKRKYDVYSDQLCGYLDKRREEL